MAADIEPRSAPTFLGVGMQKAATTWLHAQLQEHPDIWLPPRKELHFFDLLGGDQDGFINEQVIFKHLKRISRSLPQLDPDLVPAQLDELRFWIHLASKDRDLGWYQKIWTDLVPSDQIAGEITPAYSVLEPATIELTRTIGVRKIIIMLRDPIARTWSHVRMAQGKRPWLSEDFHAHPEVIARGKVRSILERWEAVYPAEDVCIGFLDELSTAEGAAQLLRRFVGHIGARPNTFEKIMEPVWVSEPRALPDEVRSFLVDAYRDDLEYCSERFGGYCTSWRDQYLD